MWRILWPDGRLSGMTNLSRAKDTVTAIVAHEVPGLNSRLLRWKQNGHESHSGARRRVRAPTPSSTIGNSSKGRLRVGRAWRIVAGPDVPDINLRLPLDPDLTVKQERSRVAVEEHVRKVQRAAARKSRPKAVPTLDLEPPPPTLHLSAPSPDDPFEIPAFLDHCRFVELEEAA
jgi:hypothetical protein